MPTYLSHTPRALTQLFMLGFLLALALGIHELSAWTAPTQTPPNCVGCTVPLHTGSGVQVKSGGLQASSLDITGTNGTSMVSGQLSFWTGGIVNPAYTIDMNDLDPGTNNGIRFPDGTVQTTAAMGGGRLSAIRTYTTAGTHTWTKPADLSYAIVEVWGGGGSGENYSGTAGSDGGTTRFGSYVLAYGGTAGSATPGNGGAGSGGDINLTGGDGEYVQAMDGNIAAAGGRGGDAAGGGGSGGRAGYSNSQSARDGQAPGGGGGGAGDYHAANGPRGGGGGGYALELFEASELTDDVTVTVGAGGVAAYRASLQGGDGAPGMVVVYEYR